MQGDIIQLCHFLFQPFSANIHSNLCSFFYRARLFYNQDDWILIKFVADPLWSSLQKMEDQKKNIVYGGNRTDHHTTNKYFISVFCLIQISIRNYY